MKEESIHQLKWWKLVSSSLSTYSSHNSAPHLNLIPPRTLPKLSSCSQANCSVVFSFCWGWQVEPESLFLSASVCPQTRGLLPHQCEIPPALSSCSSFPSSSCQSPAATHIFLWRKAVGWKGEENLQVFTHVWFIILYSPLKRDSDIFSHRKRLVQACLCDNHLYPELVCAAFTPSCTRRSIAV